MDILERLNVAVSYIENHMADDVDITKAAQLAEYNTNDFQRMFSYMSGMTLTEYIRRRRLTLATFDLQNTESNVIDIAVKYGYNSADSFSRAFMNQHGLPPSKVRVINVPLKIYPPISFHIVIKGAQEMDFRIIELEETEVYGVSKKFDGQGYETRESLRHIMWSEECDDVPGQICDGRWNQPKNHSYDGIWYGIWRNGKYMIARANSETENDTLENYIIPSGTYAAFKTERGGLAWEEFPKLFELIFDSWLSTSEYKQSSDIIIEVLHLWTDHDMRNKNRYYEVWIPVKKI